MFFRTLRCSFCRRKSDDVDKLVKGSRGYICDRCAHEVIRIMNDRPATGASTPRQPAVVQPPTGWQRTWHFMAAAD